MDAACWHQQLHDTETMHRRGQAWIPEPMQPRAAQSTRLVNVPTSRLLSNRGCLGFLSKCSTIELGSVELFAVG